MTRTALYRHFSSDGALLYVGISLDTIRRTMQHKHGAHWFERIARINIAWFETRAQALAAEARAIGDENPAYNVARPVRLVPRPVHLPPAREASPAYAVVHPRSGRFDGWYSKRDVGEHMLGWFRATFPRDAFTLLERAGGACFITSDLVLRWTQWSEWASTAPDHAAGDRFDEVAA